MGSENETYDYAISELKVLSNEEIAALKDEKEKIIYICQAAIAKTLQIHPKAQSSEVHRKTLQEELIKDFALFEIEFEKYFVLVAKRSVAGKETWNWGANGFRGAVYYRNDSVAHKYMIFVY